MAAKLEDEIRQALRAGKFDVLVVDAVPEGTTLLVADPGEKNTASSLPDVGPNLLDCSGSDIQAGYRN